MKKTIKERCMIIAIVVVFLTVVLSVGLGIPKIVKAGEDVKEVNVSVTEHPECEPGKWYKYTLEQGHGRQCYHLCNPDAVTYSEERCCESNEEARLQRDGTYECKEKEAAGEPSVMLIYGVCFLIAIGIFGIVSKIAKYF